MAIRMSSLHNIKVQFRPTFEHFGSRIWLTYGKILSLLGTDFFLKISSSFTLVAHLFASKLPGFSDFKAPLSERYLEERDRQNRQNSKEKESFVGSVGRSLARKSLLP